MLEVVWAVGLRHLAQGDRPALLALIVPVFIASVGLLGLAMREIPLGISYPLWVGIGVVGTALAGVVLFGEQLGPVQRVCLMLIVFGVLGLKML